ncbi:hypothetical protein BY996DRAFT_6412631 [Phakopsora pachyrhizi]|nr:hypothetical protein BY996DRAFT_6412631 [Phakopsora pachyrhizi]
MHAKVCKLIVSIISLSEIKISICWDLNFYSDVVKEIFVEGFLRPYNEINISDRIFLAKKCRNLLYEVTPEENEIIQLPNPWRVKADGEMIRHVPLSLYSDNTSGNVSKQWNKNISVFMSLAGLPPKLSNQEFNTLFVATWELFEQGTPKNHIQRSITETGVKDMLNQTVMKVLQENQDTRLVFNIKMLHGENKQQLFNPFFELQGFDGHLDTPVEVLHVILLGILKYLYCDLIGGLSINKKDELIARLQSFDTTNLNI